MRIPEEVHKILATLKNADFAAYIVGGCVRDLLRGTKPQDWDVATDAKPEEIQKLFPDSFCENAFGTVGVKTGSTDVHLAVVEVTTFRVDEQYSDKRHPDSIRFAETIEEDLGRRDFTINAMALEVRPHLPEYRIIDSFGGQQDLQNKVIRAVGDPDKRFQEDALRLLRAIRFATIFGFTIEEKTRDAINRNAGLLRFISKERIRDELVKLVDGAPEPSSGFFLLHETGLLKEILPELADGWGVAQNKHHTFTVFEHNVYSLDYAAKMGYSRAVRWASLFHDAGKPQTKRGEGPDATFYGHEVVSARLAARALSRLRFPKDDVEKITLLVRSHMFNYDPEIVTDASVRRLVAKVGPENIRELVQLREADRIGSGVPKAVPYRLRHFLFRVEKVLTEPVSRKMMKATGEDVMRELTIPPGPRVGAILEALFEEVLDEPLRNTKEYLLKRMVKLHQLSDKKLVALRNAAQEKYRAVLQAEEDEIKKKHRVR